MQWTVTDKHQCNNSTDSAMLLSDIRSDTLIITGKAEGKYFSVCRYAQCSLDKTRGGREKHLPREEWKINVSKIL